MKENIFVIIVCKVIEQQKHWDVIWNTVLKLVVNKGLRFPNKGKYLRYKKFWKVTIYDLLGFWKYINARIYIMWNEIQISLACSYDYELVCADDKFSKPFKSC